jgi:SIR2-like domain
MSRSIKVIILGAGCSHKYGYPLGARLGEQLQEFRASIPKGCDRIHKAVRSTVALLADRQADTLDQLAKSFEDEFHSWRKKEGSIVWTPADQEREKLADNQILDAKIATAALFLDREDEARKTGLQGYKRLISYLFGGSPWEVGVNASDCAVLTFNYDRLFEIAFCNYFKDFDLEQCDLHEERALNTGFKDWGSSGYERIEPSKERFCFLKLHGSAGWWVKKQAGSNLLTRRYCANARTPITLQDIEECFRENAPNNSPWEPLIAFPHEKHRFVNENPGDFPQGPYVTKIWEHAASILKDAKQVKVVGYSFNPIDSRDMVDKLLSQATACERMVIQNTDVDGVQAALESYRDKLKPLEFDPTPF